MAKKRNRIKIDDLDTNAIEELNEDDVRKITGGIALLLPAVQAAREASRSSFRDLKNASDSLSFKI